MDRVVRLPENQIEAAGEALARSFFDDPLAVYMIPDGRERAWLLPHHFTPFVRYGFLFGEVHTTPALDGLAVWLPASVAEITPDRAARCGLDRVEAVVGSDAWRRFSGVMAFVEQIHQSVVTGPHWYLPLIGVDPSRQGHGVGAVLLQAMLSRSDVEDLPCYLETFQPTNVRFYERNGFEMVSEGREAESGLRYWAFKHSAGRRGGW